MCGAWGRGGGGSLRLWTTYLLGFSVNLKLYFKEGEELFFKKRK